MISFYKKLGFDRLNKANRKIVISHAAYLTSLLDQSSDKNIADYLYILNEFRSYNYSKNVNKEQLLKIYSLLKNKHIQHSPIAAMLACEAQSNIIKDNEYHHLKALTLLVSVYLTTISEDKEAVIKLTRRTRLILQPRDHKILTEIKSAYANLEILLDKLNGFHEQTSLKTSVHYSKSIAAKIHQIISPINAMLAKSDCKKNTKSYRKKLTKKKSLTCRGQETYKANDFNYDIIEQKININSNDKFSLAHQAEDLAHEKLVKFKDSINKQLASSKSIKNRISINKTYSIIKSNVYAQSDTIFLTDHEIRIFFNFVFKQINESNSCIKAILLFMFLYSRSFEQTCQILSRNNDQTDERIVLINNLAYLATSVELTDFTINNTNKDYLNYVDDVYYLSIPLEIQNDIKQSITMSFHKLKNLKNELKDSFKTINKEHNTRITLAKITRAFAYYCNNSDTDKIFFEYWLNISARHSVTKYYCTLSANTINNQYIYKVKPFVNQYDINLSFDSSLIQDQLVGSKLSIKEEKITELFNQSIDYFKYKPNITLSNIIHYHNNYVLYTYLILSFATAIRRVISPFDTLINFDLVRNIVRISDKENRSNDTSRHIMLCDVASLQIDFYLKHLSNLKSILKANFNKSHLKIDEIFSSKRPFLQLFINNQFKELTAYELDFYLKQIWPLPSNWARRFMADYLKKFGLKHSLLRCFLGHEEIGLENFGRYSGFCYSDLKTIKEAIDSVFKTLNIQAIRGL